MFDSTQTNLKILNKEQRRAPMSATQTIRRTLEAVLCSKVCLEPFDLFIKNAPAKRALRLKESNLQSI